MSEPEPATAHVPEPRAAELVRAVDEDTMKLPLYVTPGVEEGFVVEAAPLAGFIRREVAFHAGPLPSPETLAEYDRVVPGFAREMADMLLNEAKHRVHVDNKMLGGLEREQWLTYGFATTVMVFAMILALVGNDPAAIAFAGADLAGVAGVVAGRRLRERKSDEDDED